MPNYMMNPGNYPANINLTEYQRQALIQMLSNPNMMQNQQGQQWGNSQNNTSQGFTPSSNQGQPIESKLVFIENFEQAKGYPVPLGGSCIMMDKNNLMLYIKHVDGDCNSAYVKYELRLVDGASTPQQQSQQIQTQGTQGEKQDQQLQSNQTQGEQMVKELLDTIKQLKENQISITERIDKAFGIVDNRLKQLENSSDT